MSEVNSTKSEKLKVVEFKLMSEYKNDSADDFFFSLCFQLLGFFSV